MIRMHVPLACATFLGICTLGAPAAAHGLHVGIHKQLGHHVTLDLGYAFHGPRQDCGPVQPRCWVPGHYECVEQRTWVPGACERVWVPARYELAYDACGRPIRRLIQVGYWQTIEHPGHWDVREVRQWIEGHWEVLPVRG